MKTPDRVMRDLVGHWRRIAERELGLRSFDVARFAEIPSAFEVEEDRLAWLPRAEVNLYLAGTASGPWFTGERWRADAGTARTIELLWAAGAVPTVASTVLLAAALRDLAHAPPAGWSPQVIALAEADFARCEAALVAAGVGTWPATAGPALPRSFASANPVLRGVPKDLDGVLLAAAVGVATTLAAWTPAVFRAPSADGQKGRP